MTAIFAVTFVMSAVLICKWTLSHYDDDDDDDCIPIHQGAPPFSATAGIVLRFTMGHCRALPLALARLSC